MSHGARFVCAFRGARDSYQAALALAESDLLDTLITDAYGTPPAVRWLPRGVREKFAGRTAPGLPHERVRSLWSTTIVEHTRHALGFSKRGTWLKLDRRFGEAAAERARHAHANLLMYSAYAWEAFTADYAHTPKRVLFQYHPHPDLESTLLADDRRRCPGFGESFGDDATPPTGELPISERDSWRHADAIICSSTFTRRSLIAAGCDERICHVIPYGIDLPSERDASGGRRFEVLFVGSGGQRKGLHHLLLALQRAALAAGSRLTLVCRVIDRGIRDLARSMHGLEIREGVSASELDDLYARSHLMAMPSLVEGFGHVYLEALARGCPVLGTANSALPDLGGEPDGIFIVPAGDVDLLASQLKALSRRLSDDATLRAAARAVAARHPWSVFRARIREVATT